MITPEKLAKVQRDILKVLKKHGVRLKPTIQVELVPETKEKA